MPVHAQALPFHCSTWPLAQVLVSPTVTVPVVPPPVRPDPAVTPVRVPVPGKACPPANVICPLLATLSPVSTGTFLSVLKSRFNDPVGLPVSLPTGSACKVKRSPIAADVVLL